MRGDSWEFDFRACAAYGLVMFRSVFRLVSRSNTTWAAALVALVVACVGNSAKQPVGKSPASGVISKWTTGEHTIVVGGLERSFLLDVPSDLRPGAALVLVFHGYTGSAKGFRKHAGFSDLVERHGFVAVYPQGTVDSRGNAFFNVGYSFHEDSEVDDVAFARQLTSQLISDLQIDPDAVFATGMSNGGDMSFFLASRAEPFIRSIAPVAGTMMVKGHESFVPKKRLSILAVHGTDDGITKWNGDMENNDGWGAYYGVKDVLDLWVQGFDLENKEVQNLEGIPAGQNQIRLHRWDTAKDDTELLFFEIQQGKHIWPDHLGRSQVTLAEEIWGFFDRHR